jgi:alpha-D-ribose 1-methylphosphonate 5-triphosphate synthase subunit PhnI
MAYVAVRGGETAINASIERLQYLRLQEGRSLDVEDIKAGMKPLIGQVMSEASLYAPDLAAVAIKQAQGSPEEAVFILRAYRSTVQRLHYTDVLSSRTMRVERRISAAFKDIPGGQILGASTDYTHRLLDFELLNENADQAARWIAEYRSHAAAGIPVKPVPKVIDYLRAEGLILELPQDDTPPKDVTTASISFPTTRSERLQVLTRGQTGAVTALGYASFRAFGGGAMHATVGELRVGMLPVAVPDPADSGDTATEDQYYIGEVQITEVETLIPVHVPRGEGRFELEFELGYGICYGQNETKAIAMSLLDHNLETADLRYPTHNEELVLLHIDSVEATGFISHLKLPHYVTFQSKLDTVRKANRNKPQQATEKGEQR